MLTLLLVGNILLLVFLWIDANRNPHRARIPPEVARYFYPMIMFLTLVAIAVSR